MSCEIDVHLQELKTAWADAILLKKNQIPDSLIGHPLNGSHPIAEALSSFGKSSLFFSKTDTLSFSELCQLAILRAPIDQGKLASQIFEFCKFPTLWSSEKCYNEQETKLSTLLLQKACGGEVSLPENMSPYFQALAKISIDSVSKEGSSFAKKVSFGKVEGAWVFQGKKASCGALRKGDIEVCAFGPQTHSLNDSGFFGANLSNEDASWTSVSSNPEIWFERTLTDAGFEVRFFGLNPEVPMFFSFYVKANRAKIEQTEFSPKSLKRFSGEAKQVFFKTEDSSLLINCNQPYKLELIPLAGDESFWGSDFLLAFEIPSFDGKMNFQFI